MRTKLILAKGVYLRVIFSDKGLYLFDMLTINFEKDSSLPASALGLLGFQVRDPGTIPPLLSKNNMER